MSHPVVSILIPCYNATNYIGETIESVLRQSWPRIEIIIVDDGSQDNSTAEIERFKDGRVQLIRQKNRGAAAARNRAYRSCTGQFVQFLDADDLIHPRKIEQQMVRLLDYPTCVASAEWGRFYGSSSEATRFDPEPVWHDLDPLEWLILSRAEGYGMLFPALWLVPRTVAEKAGGWDETLSLGDDTEYFSRVLLAANKVLFCAGARCHYRSAVPGSLSGQKSRSAWASQFRVTELCEAYVRSREDSDRVRRGFSLSWQHMAHAAYPYDADLARKALIRAKTLHPAVIRPDGGPMFNMVSRVIGWRAARRVQVACGRW